LLVPSQHIPAGAIFSLPLYLCDKSTCLLAPAFSLSSWSRTLSVKEESIEKVILFYPSVTPKSIPASIRTELCRKV
jgi:hypothetical protein